jgi:hypothetical protein
MLTAKEILKIEFPAILFNGSADIKVQFRELTKRWHPDVNEDPLAKNVFIHISELYQKAIDSLKNGTRETPNLLELEDGTHKYRIRYLAKHDLDIGSMYIGDTIVAYIIEEQYKSLVDNAQNIIKKFKFSNSDMEKEFKKYLPELAHIGKIKDKHIVVFKKSKDLLLLRDVYNYYNKKLDPKHTAWITSSLHNLLCYLDYTKIVNHNITLDTYFISPSGHTGALLGGWWFSAEVGRLMTIVPNGTYEVMPFEIRKNKIASTQTDGELVKAIGRILVKNIEDVPLPMKNWFNFAAGKKPIRDYNDWYAKVLTDSFGPKKFVKMELSSKDLYKN